MTIEGAVLVGGTSRRMGTDKAELRLGGQRVSDRLATTLRPLVSRVRFLGRPSADSPPEYEPDLLPGLGPLGGIYTALARTTEAAVLVVACDLPFVTRELIGGLLAAAAEAPEAQAIVPWPVTGPVPVCAIYRKSCLEPLRGRLERGELRATDFVESLTVRRLGPDVLRALDPEGRCLFNMNRPSDYESAVKMLPREDLPP